MKTLTVDDRIAVISNMREELKKIDPNGTHIGASSAVDAIAEAEKRVFDVAFLDIEMPDMNGIMLARKIKDIQPDINIIFVTGHSEYAVESYRVGASDYLMKPAGEEEIRHALQNLRTPLDPEKGPGIEMRCFGSFIVYKNGQPVAFKRSKCKELLAYLVLRRGASCSMDELASVLWTDAAPGEQERAYLRKIIQDLRTSLREIGEEDIIVKGWNKIAIDTKKIGCDYYRFLEGDSAAVNSYHGVFMEEYPWAGKAFLEEIQAVLRR